MAINHLLTGMIEANYALRFGVWGMFLGSEYLQPQVFGSLAFNEGLNRVMEYTHDCSMGRKAIFTC